jgi:hypothetical protein
MIDVLLILPACFFVYLIGVTLNALRHARLGGVVQTEELMRAGVSLNRLRRGDLEEPDSGSSVTVREGIVMARTADGGRGVVPTRTISRDLY